MDGISIVKKVELAYGNKDRNAFLAVCREDLEWIYPKGFPYSGHYYRAESAFAHIPDFHKEWEG